MRTVVALPAPLAAREYISALDLFRVGIGPSSSHTVGPLRAAQAFVQQLATTPGLDTVARVECDLFGSLGSTGVGHGTLGAVLAGLAGCTVETVTHDDVERVVADADHGMLALGGTHRIALDPQWLRFMPQVRLERHPNALELRAFDAEGHPLALETYYSVGGGFVEHEGDAPQTGGTAAMPVPYPFDTAVELLHRCRTTGLGLVGLARENEHALRGEAATTAGLRAVAAAMTDCIDRGLSAEGILPGGLKVPRRAAAMAAKLRAIDEQGTRDTSPEWLQAYAIAVNEENAAGGRVVTAPTNGAAGIIPAVLRHALDTQKPADPVAAAGEFLLVAAVFGALIKSNASISGAEAGCQGEVGSAASMAAAGFAHLLGGTPEQVENAAEIAMEHSLGLTCDPVSGLVQLPCIERNAIGAGHAVAAARIAMHGDGTHLISFDTVVETMRQTGEDMSTKYKETSEGGLAVNVVEC
ncbi:L-serine ammonia-lyase [Microcella pacifica]|uniref:L-serine ammonia-lyase n=1 Tax=Microcella pacifica TaxID=2591847 RepID=UPI002E2E04AA|nr:L-serine ammonia-lyase [Microcella pacifica]